MLIIILYNRDLDRVLSRIGRQNTERYGEDTIRSVESIFRDHGYDTMVIDGNLDVFENLRKIDVGKEKIPFVFNMAYGIQGESRYSHIPSILEMLGLPYLGSGPEGHSLALDKAVSKIIMEYHGIPTPSFAQVYSDGYAGKKMKFPVVVKPAMEAGSKGVEIAHDPEELDKLLSAEINEFGAPVIIEEFIGGKEYALGLLGNGDALECLPLIEIELENATEAVFSNNKKQFRPHMQVADIPGEALHDIQARAKALFQHLRLRDYGRVDLRIDEQGRSWFLEINSMAGLQATGLLMGAAEKAGYSYEGMILKLFEIAAGRYTSILR